MASFYVRTNRGSNSETFENPNSFKSGLYILQLLIPYVNCTHASLYTLFTYLAFVIFYMFILILMLFVGGGEFVKVCLGTTTTGCANFI